MYCSFSCHLPDVNPEVHLTSNDHLSAYLVHIPATIRLHERLIPNQSYKPEALQCLYQSQQTGIVLVDIISRLDGIILIGGADIHPSYYNEEPIEQLGEVDSLRDVYDISLIRLAAQRGVPMLGICRGEQLINVAFGGTLYQDIPAQHPDTTVRHNQEEPSSVPTHAVNLLPDSEMARITGETQLFTNTHHHQAVKQVAPGFRITAWATDSIPEAIENIEGKPIWGVQFHPEALTVAGDSISARFFYFLVDQAIAFRQSK